MTDTDLRRLVYLLSRHFNDTATTDEGTTLSDDEIYEINRLLELFEAWTLGVVRWQKG